MSTVYDNLQRPDATPRPPRDPAPAPWPEVAAVPESPVPVPAPPVTRAARPVAPSSIWYVRGDGDAVEGPIVLSALCDRAADGRLLPGHQVSRDLGTWMPAEELADLRMVWIAENSDGTVFGPFNLLALPALYHQGLVPADAKVVNRIIGTSKRVFDVLSTTGATLGPAGDERALAEQSRWEDLYRREKRLRLQREAELQRTIDSVSAESGARAKDVQELGERLSALTSAEKSLRTKAEAKHETMARELTIARERTAELEQRDREQAARLKELQGEHDALVNKFTAASDSLRSKTETYDAFRTKTEARQKDLFEALDQASRKLVSSEQQVETLRTELNAIKQTAADTQQGRDKAEEIWKGRLSEQEARIRELEQALKKASDQASTGEQLKGEKTALDERIQILESRLKDRTRHAESLEKELVQAREEAASRTDATRELEVSMGRQTEARAAELDAARKKNVELTERLERLDAELETARATADEGVAEVRKRLDGATRERDEAVRALERSTRDGKQQQDEQAVRISELETRCADLMESATQREAEVEAQTAEKDRALREAEAGLAAARTEADDLRRRCDVLARDHERLKETSSESAALGQKVSELNSELSRVQTDLGENRTRLEAVTRENGQLKKDFSEREQRAGKETEKKLKDAESRAGAAVKEAESLRKTRKELEGRCTELQDTLARETARYKEESAAREKRLAEAEAGRKSLEKDLKSERADSARSQEKAVSQEAKRANDAERHIDVQAKRIEVLQDQLEQEKARGMAQREESAAQQQEAAQELRDLRAAKKETDATALELQKRLKAVRMEHEELSRKGGATSLELLSLQKEHDALQKESKNAQRAERKRIRELEVALEAAGVDEDDVTTTTSLGWGGKRLVVLGAGLVLALGVGILVGRFVVPKATRTVPLLPPVEDELAEPDADTVELPPVEDVVTSPAMAVLPAVDSANVSRVKAEPVDDTGVGPDAPLSGLPTASVVTSTDDEGWPDVFIEGAQIDTSGDTCSIVFSYGIFSGGERLAQRGQRDLELFALQIRPHMEAFVLTIEGHTDAVPVAPGAGYADNRELGLRRAKVVRDLLVDVFSLPDESILVESAGSDRPPYPNDTEESQRKNRTVVLRLSRRMLPTP